MNHPCFDSPLQESEYGRVGVGERDACGRAAFVIGDHAGVVGADLPKMGEDFEHPASQVMRPMITGDQLIVAKWLLKTQVVRAIATKHGLDQVTDEETQTGLRALLQLSHQGDDLTTLASVRVVPSIRLVCT